jgi:hypothetical protein
MQTPVVPKGSKTRRATLMGELLILGDGRVLAHHLTPALAQLLSDLNPADDAMRQRAAHRIKSREQPRNPADESQPK